MPKVSCIYYNIKRQKNPPKFLHYIKKSEAKNLKNKILRFAQNYMFDQSILGSLATDAAISSSVGM